MCSHIPLKERTQIRKVMLQKWRHKKKRKHSVFSHFPTDRNWDVCLRTKITRVPCRSRYEISIPRTKIFGDLITAEHKVLSDNCEFVNLTGSAESENTNKNEDDEELLSELMQDVPERLQDVKENLVDKNECLATSILFQLFS